MQSSRDIWDSVEKKKKRGSEHVPGGFDPKDGGGEGNYTTGWTLKKKKRELERNQSKPPHDNNGRRKGGWNKGSRKVMSTLKRTAEKKKEKQSFDGTGNSLRPHSLGGKKAEFRGSSKLGRWSRGETRNVRSIRHWMAKKGKKSVMRCDGAHRLGCRGEK